MTIAHIHVSDTKNKGDVAIVLAVQELLKKYLNDPRITDIPVDYLKTGQPKKIIDKINSCDLVIIGGGGIFYRWFLPFKTSVINAIKKPIIIFGVGHINELGAPPLTKKQCLSVVKLVEKSSLCGVRDIYTRQWLKKLGVSPKKIDLIGDPAIFLKEKKSLNTPTLSKINIGLNLNYSGWLGFGHYQNTIIDSYNRIIRFFEDQGGQIFYLQHHPDERRIITALKSRTIKVINKTPATQKYLYGRMDMIVGMMLHSAVMAFGAGTPAINLGYDLRNKSFADYIGLPELHLACPDLTEDNLLVRCQEVWRQRQRYKKIIAHKKTAIWKTHYDFIKKIKAIQKITPVF